MNHHESSPAVFSYRQKISDEFIDVNKHVNNVVYVQWMQDAAVAHSRSCLQRGTVREGGFTWVARSHHIEYLSPAFAGDELEIRTWLMSLGRVRCQRKYEFVRNSDGILIAQGETDWVFVNAETGRPASIPEEIRSAFAIFPDSKP